MTRAAESGLPDGAKALPRLRGVLSDMRMSRGFQTAVRVFGSAWFLILGIVPLMSLFEHGHSIGTARFAAQAWADLLSRACIVVFYLILGTLILIRPAPLAQSEGLLPSFMAFLGTYLPWLVPALPSRPVSAPFQMISAALLVCGGALIILTVLHLGRSFSLVPQARRLVRTGPYGLIRHPLYLAEEISISGAVLHFLSLWTFALFIVHCGIQLRRMCYEEALLTRTFPDYRRYAAMTSRIIPMVW